MRTLNEWDLNSNTTKISYKKALEMLHAGTHVVQEDIVFTDELVDWLDVQKLNDAGIRVPRHLIHYDDETIDYTDHPSIETLINEQSYAEVFTVSFDPEIAKWIRKYDIDYNILINDFMKTIYKSVQKVK